MTQSQPNLTNLIAFHERSIKQFADRPAFGIKQNGKYVWTTYREFGEITAHIRGGLAHYGVTKDDCVAIISDNCIEWAASAYAAYGLLAHFTPMYEKQLESDWRYIVEDCDAKVLLVADKQIFDVVEPWISEIDSLEHVFIIKAPADDPNSLAALMKIGEENPIPNPTNVDANQLAALIYTSGTTGDPRGVMLSHANICANINAVDEILKIDTEQSSLAFLPWAHIFGQTCEVHVMLSRGATVALVESIDKIIDNLAEVRPTILFSVPRIFNRIYAKVQKTIRDSSPVKRKLFKLALENSQTMIKEIEQYGQPSFFTQMQDKFYDQVVLSKVREKFGGNLKFCFSGGAALSPEVARFIDNLHITVYEGYGLTETSPIVAANRPGGKKIGSIGIPLPNVDVKVAPAEGYDEPNVGELCVRGPNVMMGYYKHPEKTAEVMDDDGFFHTGDLARIDKDGFLYIIGRVKEQYKLENGKYVVPAPLEESLKLSPYIVQAVIEGTNRRYNVAIFVLDMAEVEEWAVKNGITVDKSIFDNEKLHELIRGEVEEYSKDFKRYEKPRKWILTDKEMTTENGLLTPSLKVKRREVFKIWGDDIDALYND